jgi:hypothetical protein
MIRFGLLWGKMLVGRPSCMVMALLVAAALSGCAGNGPQLPSLSAQPASETASTDAASVVGATAPPASLSEPNGEPPGIPVPGAVGSATDIYSDIARGAMACWFAVNGPLKKDFIFHATADAPSRGGKAEIIIHRRDPTQPNPRGVKSYIVEIQPTGEASASVTVENRKMSDTYAAAMHDDISRWSKGEEGCAGSATAAGWAPAPIGAVADAPKAAKKAKKAKLKAAQAKPALPSQNQP